MKKIVNNIEMDCTTEEESEIKSLWDDHAKKEAIEKPQRERKKSLEERYPNILEAIDALYQKLGL